MSRYLCTAVFFCCCYFRGIIKSTNEKVWKNTNSFVINLYEWSDMVEPAFDRKQDRYQCLSYNFSLHFHLSVCYLLYALFL